MSVHPQASIDWVSERHLRVSFDSRSSGATPRNLRHLAQALTELRMEGLVSVTPALATVLIELDLRFADPVAAEASVRRAVASTRPGPDVDAAPIRDIPVCYEGPCAPDAEDVARRHGLSVEALVEAHSSTVYEVQFIGFAPGFSYLAGLPDRLVTPRLQTPRVRVPAGSVGIAGHQTGIYALETPGGWRLIGRTPLVMFHALRDTPSLLAAGDRVRFVPMTHTEFEARFTRERTVGGAG